MNENQLHFGIYLDSISEPRSRIFLRITYRQRRSTDIARCHSLSAQIFLVIRYLWSKIEIGIFFLDQLLVYCTQLKSSAFVASHNISHPAISTQHG